MDRVIVPCMTAGMGACRSLQDKGSCSRARQCGAAFFCQKSCSQRLFFIDQGETKQKRLCSVPVSASRVGVRVASACELRDSAGRISNNAVTVVAQVQRVPATDFPMGVAISSLVTTRRQSIQ